MNKETLKSIAKDYVTTLPLAPAALFIGGALGGMIHTKSKTKDTLLAMIIGTTIMLPEIVYRSFLEVELKYANKREEHFGKEYKDWIFKEEKPE